MARQSIRFLWMWGLSLASVALPSARGEELIGMPPQWLQMNALWSMDRSDGEFGAGVAVYLPGTVVHGCLALATHPMTGEVWGLLGDRDGGRLLCKIDPQTGQATLIGNTTAGNRRFAALAFNADGSILYGGTGNNGNDQQSLFSLNQTNAAATLLCAFSTSDFGNALAFNSSDMKLYRGNGSSTFQTIDDTGTCASTGIGVTGSVFEFNSLTYHAMDDLFYVASFDQFSTVTSTGTITNLSSLAQYIKGITPTDSPPSLPPCFPRAFVYVTAEHTFSNESFLWGYYADGSTRLIGPIGFDSVRAMDFGPDQRLYAFGERMGSGERVLIRIDPCTGAGTEVALSSTGNFVVTDMSFRASDNVLFVLNSNHRLLRVNQATGNSTSVGNTSLDGSGDGIAFSDAGTLFHADNASLNTLNTGNGNVTFVNSLDFSSSPGGFEIEAMDFRPGTDDLYGLLDGDSVHLATIDTSTGVVTSLQQIISEARTMAFGPAPAICDPQSITFDYIDINSGDWTFEDSCDNCDSGLHMLPFAPFNIGGEIYPHFVQYSNGYVELTNSDPPYGFGFGNVADLIADGDPDHTYLMAAYDDLDSSSFGQFGFHADSNRIIFFWKVETHADQGANNVNEFQIILWADGRVQWNFQTDEVAAFSHDLFSGIYLGYDRQQLFEIASGDIPEGTSWLFGDCPIGSCCYPDGHCAVTVESNCNGTWTLGGTCAPNNCPQPMGSCCAGDGTCTVTTQVACQSIGVWTLNGTCSPNPCPPVGSCCATDGTCTIRSEANCTGEWTEGGVCDPNPCPEPPEPPEPPQPMTTGACCLLNGSCQELTAALCDAAGGTYAGDDTLCAATDCSTVLPNNPCGQPMCGSASAATLVMILGLLGQRRGIRRHRRGRQPRI